MRYVSTRGRTSPMPFQDAVMTGLAPDGGLLLPESIPDLGSRLDDWRGLGFAELAVELFEPFIGDLSREELERIVAKAFASFRHPDVAPLVQVGDLRVLELFHGPTLAFKDIAMQVLGGMFEHMLNARGGRLNILCATSGDTGSAAIAGARNRPNIGIFVLYPDGGTSELQARQMTTTRDSNVHCLAIRGTFDDCQRVVKSIFGDLEFKGRFELGAVNSVNWARLMAQIVYYFHTALKLDRPVAFSVPTGNFGDILAGYLARAMGAPIDRLILATNSNDILARFFATGVYALGPVHRTISPSMDIQVASNFERFLYYRLGSSEALETFMADFAADGSARIEDGRPMDESIVPAAVSEEETMATIGDVYARHGYVLDPHTAVGVAAARRHQPSGPVVCLATAHPAKFPDSVNAAAGQDVAHHPALDGLADLPERKTVLPPDVDAVKKFIATHA
ncbi:MAG: threonine synthase [Gammaproteobacteria bacterium]|nr:threonine synthase [Gammaproteobacteria bacterium]